MKIAFVYYGYIVQENVANSASWSRLVALVTLARNCNVNCTIYGLSRGDAPKYSLEGITYVPIKKPDAKINWFAVGNEFAKHLSNEDDIDIICYVSAFTRLIFPIREMIKIKRPGIKEMLIANDWYSKGTLSFLNYLDSEFAWKYLYPSIPNVISISSAFENYFKKYSRNQIRIPSIFPLSLIDKENKNLHGPSDNSSIIFTYAGNLKFNGKKVYQKDLIANFHYATSYLSESEKDRVVLRVIGTTKKDYRETTCKLFPDFEWKDACKIEFYDFLSGKELYQIIANSHFTLLFRPDMHYARFGFSTKFAESMVLSVPVFANITSDMDLYLRDGCEGIIAKDESVESILEGIRRILNLSWKEYLLMRKSARLQAERSFDMNAYQNEMCKFLEAMAYE